MVSSARKRPLVGLGLIIVKEDSVLLGKRFNGIGNGSWSFPGDYLAHGEGLYFCAVRVLNREVGNVGADLIDKFPIKMTNDYFKEEDKHYVTFYLRALYKRGSPELLPPKEKDKYSKWEWFRWEDLKSGDIKPLFLPVKNLLTQNFNLFELAIDEDDHNNIDLGKPRIGEYTDARLIKPISRKISKS